MPDKDSKKAKDSAQEDIKKQEDSIQESVKKGEPKKLYKKAWFWLVILLSVIGLGVAVFAFIYFSAQSRNKQSVTSGWGDIVKQSNVMSSVGEGVNDKDSFDKYNVELQKLNATVKDKKINAEKLSYQNQDVQKYRKFLDDFGAYTEQASEYANKINDYTETNNTKLKELSVVAKDSSNNVRSGIKYLNESMPESAFKIQDVLANANKIILAKELSIQAAQKAAEALSAKDKADRTAVENNTGNYLNAFIAGNASTMRRYMTSAFQAEYNFGQIAPDARTIVYPASFRILTVSKVDSNNYKSQANVLYKYRDGSGQYTVGNELNLIYDSASASWLVNSVREGSAY